MCAFQCGLYSCVAIVFDFFFIVGPTPLLSMIVLRFCFGAVGTCTTLELLFATIVSANPLLLGFLSCYSHRNAFDHFSRVRILSVYAM